MRMASATSTSSFKMGRVFAILTSIVLIGCSSTIQVQMDEPLDNDGVFNYEQVNARLAGRVGMLVSRDGAVYEITGLHVARDSTAFSEGSGVRRVIPTREVAKIRFKEHAAGVLSGGLLGSLIGLTGGVGALVLSTDRTSDSRMGLAFLLVGLMGGGGIIGAVVGGVEGSTVEFQFRAESQTESAKPRTGGTR